MQSNCDRTAPFFRLTAIVRRPLFLLLALFLLLTQQLAVTHAVHHREPAAIAATGGESLAGDVGEYGVHACALCGVAAQYAAVLPAFPLRLQPAEPAPAFHAVVPVSGVEAGTPLAFRSRAPPLA